MDNAQIKALANDIATSLNVLQITLDPLVQKAADVYYGARQIKAAGSYCSVPSDDVEWEIVSSKDGIVEINIRWERWDQDGTERGSDCLSLDFVLNENGEQQACTESAKKLATENSEKQRLMKIAEAERAKASAERTLALLTELVP